MKLGLIQLTKNIIISPLLLAKAITAGIKGIGYEFISFAKRDYDLKCLIIAVLVLIEGLISVKTITLVPTVLHMDKALAYYSGAGVFWWIFVILYSLTEKDYKTYINEENAIWNCLDDVAPLFIIAVDAVTLLTLGLIM